MSDRPLRILHLTAGSDAGGLSRYIHDLCAAMHARGHDVAVAGERGAWHWLFEEAPWPWIDAPLKGGAIDLWRCRRVLRRWMSQRGVDVLPAHYRRATLVGRWMRGVSRRGRRVPARRRVAAANGPGRRRARAGELYV